MFNCAGAEQGEALPRNEAVEGVRQAVGEAHKRRREGQLWCQRTGTERVSR